jgi:membrane-bound serine protease (ClpP class)
MTRTFLRQRRRLPWVGSLAILVGLLVLVAAACGPGGEPGAVHILTTDGDVNPVMERYIDRGIDNAEDNQASAVVIRLDTPGGLVTSMEDIVQRILATDVPVIVYVWPSGGKAASAGTFITMAAHVAAMAPSTRIGAAHPVGSGGEDIEGDLGDKVTNDAVALIKSIARERGRNEQWAEDAVRKSVSVFQDEAVELNVVDLVADDLPSLLAAVDGRTVQLPQGETVLHTKNEPLVYNDMNAIERFLDLISDPNITFLLLGLGSLALLYEFMAPGHIFPGVFGAIALIIAFFSLSVLPFNWAGLALILVAFILFALELFVTSHGILGIGGVVALVLGGLLLTSGNPPEFQVSKWLIYGLAAGIGAFFLFVVTSIIRVRRMPAVVTTTLVGRQAVARSPLDPTGMVFLDGEYWSATVEEGRVEPGERVMVTGMHGLMLTVSKAKGVDDG